MLKPFILITKKQKTRFVDFTLRQIEVALSESGRKMSVSTKLNFRFKMLKTLGVVNQELTSLDMRKKR